MDTTRAMSRKGYVKSGSAGLGVLTTLALIGSCPCFAQEVHFTVDGREGESLWGVGGTGDIDSDGVPDVVLGAINGGSKLGYSCYVIVVSGLDGSLLLGPIFGPFANDCGRDVAGAGDFDGDGVPDFMQGNPTTDFNMDGEAVIYSGADAHELVTVEDGILDDRFGWRVGLLGDLNQDGFPEVGVVSLRGTSLYIYSGPNGALFRKQNTNGAYNIDFETVGDIDGDGVPDYAMGHWGEVQFFLGDGLAVVYSGATGTELLRVIGDGLLDNLGASVAGLADVDGDGIDDFAVGAPGCGAVNQIACPPGSNRGYVRIYSGADASIIHHLDGPGPDPFDQGGFGHRMEGGADVNGDGAGDLLITGESEHNNKGAVTVVSGRTATWLWKVRPEQFEHAVRMGLNMSMLQDLNGDGCDEFVLGDPGDDSNGLNAGRASVFLGFPGDAERTCTTSPNSVGPGALIALKGPISVGNNELALTVSGAVPGQVGQFIYASKTVQVPYGDGVLCVGGPGGIVRLSGPLTIDPSGALELPVDFTKPPLLSGPKAWSAGSSWTVQFVYRDPGGPGGTGFNSSDAMRITFTP